VRVSRSSSHTGACLPLSRHVGRHPSPRNIDIPVPTLLRPAIDASPPNEARRPTVEMSSPLSPLRLPSSGFLRTVDQQIDTQAPNRRRASDSSSSRSRPLPPLLEDPLDPNTPALLQSAPSQSTTRKERNPTRPNTAPSPSASPAPSSDLRRTHSSSSQSTSGTSGSSKLRMLFGNKRSQTTPDTSPGITSDSSRPSTSSSSNSSLQPGTPPAKPPPNRSRTTPTKTSFPKMATPTKKNSKMAAPQPTRSATLFIDLPQSRKWEPVSPVVLGLMEKAASDSEGLLRPATDGTVSSGNLEGLVFRVITDIEDPSRNDHFRATFLTIYQLFATSERLFHILKRRFESSELDPVAARSRYPYVNNALPSNEY
jgi:hypothetical protein